MPSRIPQNTTVKSKQIRKKRTPISTMTLKVCGTMYVVGAFDRIAVWQLGSLFISWILSLAVSVFKFEDAIMENFDGQAFLWWVLA